MVGRRSFPFKPIFRVFELFHGGSRGFLAWWITHPKVQERKLINSIGKIYRAVFFFSGQKSKKNQRIYREEFTCTTFRSLHVNASGCQDLVPFGCMECDRWQRGVKFWTWKTPFFEKNRLWEIEIFRWIRASVQNVCNLKWCFGRKMFFSSAYYRRTCQRFCQA